MKTKTPTGAVYPCALTELELNWVVHFLDYAAAQLSNMTCNDFAIEDTPEHRRLLFEYEQWNSGGDGWDGFRHHHDYLFCFNADLPSILAAKIRGWTPPEGAWWAEEERVRIAKIAELEEELAVLRGER